DRQHLQVDDSSCAVHFYPHLRDVVLQNPGKVSSTDGPPANGRGAIDDRCSRARRGHDRDLGPEPHVFESRLLEGFPPGAGVDVLARSQGAGWQLHTSSRMVKNAYL